MSAIRKMNVDPKNGLMTKVWGPPGWFFLHAVTYGFPIDPHEFDVKNNLTKGTTQKRYHEFFTNVGFILPCKFCRDSYQKFVTETPIALGSRDELTKWFWTIHNKVNNKLDVDYPEASPENVAIKYERLRAQCSAGKSIGCTIPLNGKKLRSVVIVFPDLCMVSIVSIATVLALALYLVCSRK